KRLKNLLTRNGLLSEEDAERGAALAVEKEKPLAEILVAEGFVDERKMLGLLARETSVPPIDLEKTVVEDEILDSFGQDLATYYGVLPISKLGDILTMAVSDPFDVLKLDDIRIIANCDIRPVIATEVRIRAAIDRIYNKRQREMDDLLAKDGAHEMILQKSDEEGFEAEDELAAIQGGDESSPVVKFVNLLIMEAIKAKASDVHIEPMEKRIRMRFRVDGVLQDVNSLGKAMLSGLVSRVKVISDLDIAERGRPQDGMFQMRVDRRKVDFRVSVVPTVYGEKVVLRILDGSSLVLSLEGLGFEPKCLEDYRWAIHQPYGMILATGPSGSGKTTTLYSGLKEILSPDDNVITVEDPVECQMEGVNQVQVNQKAGLTFAAALRSFLRQDPDKIMVGEIRDNETIEIALRAALTGHLVLSSIHANDAAQSITRILNMGVDRFLVASTGLIITAQRLARRVCTECREPLETDPESLVADQFTPEEAEGKGMYRANPRGCPRCHKGYLGRLAVIEGLRFTENIRRAVIEGSNAIRLKKIALEEGMISLRRAGIRKVVEGITSLEEVKRVTLAD
ncbi:MAG: GspE/PulE family protein, partial [Planctomycetota bacterium]